MITSRPILQYVFLYLRKVLWDTVFLCDQVGFRVTRKPSVTSHLGILSDEIIEYISNVWVFSP